MSHFYASVVGSAKTQATRQGTPNSGISGHIRGWNLGVRVNGEIERDSYFKGMGDDVNISDEDAFHLFATGGSGGATANHFIGTVVLDEERGPILLVNRSLLERGYVKILEE